jgi:hypothetical protein
MKISIFDARLNFTEYVSRRRFHENVFCWFSWWPLWKEPGTLAFDMSELGMFIWSGTGIPDFIQIGEISRSYSVLLISTRRRQPSKKYSRAISVNEFHQLDLSSSSCFKCRRNQSICFKLSMILRWLTTKISIFNPKIRVYGAKWHPQIFSPDFHHKDNRMNKIPLSPLWPDINHKLKGYSHKRGDQIVPNFVLISLRVCGWRSWQIFLCKSHDPQTTCQALPLQCRQWRTDCAVLHKLLRHPVKLSATWQSTITWISIWTCTFVDPLLL